MRRLGLTVTLILALSIGSGGAVAAAGDGSLAERIDEARAVVFSDWDLALAGYRDAAQRAASLDGDPAVRARTLESLGELGSALGLPREAAAHYELALAQHAEAGQGREIGALQRLTSILGRLGEHEREEELLRELLDHHQSAMRPSSKVVAAAMVRLATAIRKQRPDDPEAEGLLERRIEIDPTYEAFRDLGNLFVERGEHERALAPFAAALEVTHEDPRQLGRAPQAHTDLARAYEALGRVDEAEAQLRLAVTSQRAHYATEHPYVAGSLSRLGKHYVDQGRYRDAVEPLRRALTLKETAYGQCDRCNRDVVAMLTTVHDALGMDVDFCATPVADESAPGDEIARKDDLRELDERVLELRERGEYAAAFDLAREAQELREVRFGPDSVEAARGLERQTRLAMYLGRTELRHELRLRQLEILELQPEPNDARLAATLQALGRLAKDRDDFEAAESYYRRALAIREALGQNLWTGQTLRWLGEVALERGDARRAAEYFFDATEVWEQLAGRDAAEYARDRTELATVYADLGMLDESERTLAEIVDVERDRERPRPRILTDALKALRELYVTTGRPAEAAELEASIAELEPRK